MNKKILKTFLFSCFCFLSSALACMAIQIRPYDGDIEMAFNCSDPSIFNRQGKIIYYYDNYGNLIKQDLCEGAILTPTLDCEFDGWYYDISYTNRVTATNTNDAVDKIIYDRQEEEGQCFEYGRFGAKLYAKCKNPTPTCQIIVDKSYKVHYMVDGVEVQNKTFTYGVNESLTVNYNEPDDKTFDGWYVDSSYTNKLSTLTTDKLNVTEKKNDEDCTIGYNDVYLYAKLIDTTRVCPNIDNMEYIVHYIVDNKEVGTDTVKKGTDKELMKYELSSSDCTLSSWYNDKELTNKISSNKIADISVTPNLDIDNCIVSYNDIYVYAINTCKGQKNPETGDNIIVYIAGGIILIGLAALVVKKLLSK